MTVEVYGAETRTNWLHYGAEDPFVRRAATGKCSYTLSNAPPDAPLERLAGDGAGSIIQHQHGLDAVGLPRVCLGVGPGADQPLLFPAEQNESDGALRLEPGLRGCDGVGG